MITERINIDVRPGGVPVVIHVTQYEAGLREFVFTPYTSAGELTVVAGSATLEGTKPDGYAFQQACQMIDGVITYTLQEQLCAVEGRVWSRLVIRDTDGGMIGYTAIVWVVGCAGVKDDAVMSDSDISALRQFLDEFGDIDAYRGALNGALAAVGGPLVAATASEMTDTTKVYVYTGSESGYTEGHWYYWSGSAWTDGGVYQSTGINTDKTLTVEDMAADAKATGDAVTELNSALSATEQAFGKLLVDKSDLAWELGGIGNTGWDVNNVNTRWRTTNPIFVKKGSKISVESPCYYQLALYTSWTSNHSFVFQLNVPRGNTPYTLQQDAYVRIVLSDSNSGADVSEMLSTLTNALNIEFLSAYNVQNDFAKMFKPFEKPIMQGSTELTDFDDAIINTIYTITGQASISHKPVENNRSGTLMTFCGVADENNTKYQIFVDEVSNLYSRVNFRNAWGNWIKVAANALSSNGLRISTNNLQITDFNSAEPNTVYTIVTDLDNAPKEKQGTLITLNGAVQYASGNAQLFFSTTGNIYTRILWGGGKGIWTPWKCLIDEVKENAYSGIEMFERFGVIGDSFASGTIYTPGVTSDRENYSLSWGQMLARMSGSECTNYAAGGMSTYQFTNPSDSKYNTYGMGKVLSDISIGNACGLYLLCLGINDSNSTKTYGDKTGGLAYLGSSADIDASDYSNNANSFWGNYGRIIQQIQSQSPNSRLIMCTFCRIPTEATSKAYRAYVTAIQDIAEYFSIPCIVLTDDQYFNSSFYMNNMVGSHPTAPQYVGYAKGIERLLSSCIVNNYSYFKEYIGT